VEDAVAEEINPNAAAFAEKGRFRHAPARQGLAGFGEIDVSREIRKTHSLTDLAALIEQRLTQFTITKPAAEAFDLLALDVLIALGDTAYPFGSNVAGNGLFHFDENKLSLLLVGMIQFQHAVTGRS